MGALLAAAAVGFVLGVAGTVVFIARTSHLIVARLNPAERAAWARKVNAAATRR